MDSPNDVPTQWPTQWPIARCPDAARRGLAWNDAGLPTQKTLLIVEDNFLIAESLAGTVARMGFLVVGPVDSVDGALRKIDEAAPDCVLLDAQLREGNSSPVADVLSARHVPFVVVTGYRRETLPAVLQQAPYVAKPFNEAELIDVVNSTCG